jgi:putative ABC transport system substrate-binding protein
VFAEVTRLNAGALIISPDVFFSSHVDQLAKLAIGHGVPAIYQYRPFVDAGGLLSYGSDEADIYRLVGIYTAKVPKGVKPAELPVQQSTKVEFIVNLRTAKALGLAIPPSLLARADEVIE